MNKAIQLGEVPLSRFPQIRTRSLEALAHSIAPHYGLVEFKARGLERKVSIVANHCNLNSIALTWARHGTAIDIALPSFEYFGQLFAYSGSATARRGSSTIEVSKVNSFIANAGETANLSYKAEFEQFVLKIRPPALTKKLEAISGASLNGHLHFGPSSSVSLPGCNSLYRMTIFLAQLLNEGMGLHPLVLEELEDAIIVSFLCANQHNFSTRFNGEPHSNSAERVRIAEQYIEANWDQPITIEALAVVTGVASRSLFYQFRKIRGYSPKTFVARIRLERAYRMLSAPDLNTTVTDVAFTCGFGNLGHFARYYRELFGEHPSFTLRKARSAYRARKTLSDQRS